MTQIKNAGRWLKRRMLPQGVIWPSFKQSMKNTGKVLAIAGGCAAIFAVADAAISALLRLVI